MTGWLLTHATVFYSCGTCSRVWQREAHAQDPATYNVPVASVCPCGGLVGIHRVLYRTVGDVPIPGANSPAATVHTDKNVTPSDSEAAAALGIELQPPGGADESSEDDNVH